MRQSSDRSGAEELVQVLEDVGVDYIFCVAGGTILPLLEALRRSTVIRLVHCHHEQACAMAAESYARRSGRIGVVLVSNGPGVTNTLTGVAAAYIDSSPLLVLSGEVKNSARADRRVPGLRQGGIQQTSTAILASPIVKEFKSLDALDSIARIADKAVRKALTGRQGPVWLEIPLDVQTRRGGCAPNESDDDVSGVCQGTTISPLVGVNDEWLATLQEARRPLVVLGNGARLAPDLHSSLLELQTAGIPVVGTWGIRDMLYPLGKQNLGSLGVSGDRLANIAVASADALFAIGVRLNDTHVGYDLANFAEHAKIVHFDIDANEIDKLEPLKPRYMGVTFDLRHGIAGITGHIAAAAGNFQRWAERLSLVSDAFRSMEEPVERVAGFVNSFDFIRELDSQLTRPATIVLDAGTSYRGTLPTLRAVSGRRVLFAGGLASMGSGLPGLIGGHLAAPNDLLVGVFGDGGIQMNIQEMETVAFNEVPAKVFILNDNGYMAISNSQKRWFGGNLEGSSRESGLSTPDFVRIAQAYRWTTLRLDPADPAAGIAEALSIRGPVLVDVPVSREQSLMPRIESREVNGVLISPPIHHMYPFIDESALEALRTWLLTGLGNPAEILGEIRIQAK